MNGRVESDSMMLVLEGRRTKDSWPIISPGSMLEECKEATSCRLSAWSSSSLAALAPGQSPPVEASLNNIFIYDTHEVALHDLLRNSSLTYRLLLHGCEIDLVLHLHGAVGFSDGHWEV